MNVVRFPHRKFSASAELRASAMAKPARRLEATIVIDGTLAETVTVGAGQAGVTPAAFIVRSLHALFGGGHAA